MGLFDFVKPPLPSIHLVHNQVALRFPVEADFPAWTQLREISRDHTKAFEPDAPKDELNRSAWTRRLHSFSLAWRQDKAKLLYIFEQQSQKLVGVITLSNIRRGPAKMATIGYWVGAPFVRKGYASDAVACVLEYGFTVMGLARMEAACLPDNIASRGVLLKCGFAWEGYAKNYLHINGQRRDHVLYGLTREDFEARNKA